MLRNPFASTDEPWDPSHRFVTSWLLPPAVLAVLRGLFSLYIFVTLLFVIAWECRHVGLGGCAAAGDEFSYFTVLTYWGLAFYFAVAAVHTATYARTGSALLDRFPRVLQQAHGLLYSTIAVFPFIVTAVYWGKLYAGAWFPLPFDAWRNVSQHAMNSGFALFEVVFARTAPQPWLHVVGLIALLALYLALAYITRATKGFYVYSFLDPAQKGGSGLIAAYVFGIAIGCLVVFAVVQGALWVRRWATETKLGMPGKFARNDRQAVDMEMARPNKA
ncbi:hypothetical protein SPBR_07740 [Sporothrix brasiliensis 5110]|uniref:FAR-17a/AIG1-like protein n=1 Tax=Sporothrix brasiliensis 5110 TaxID=1398154 RepID=A0A0C2IN65_9PEZI|nr:uncharacterized protein SPBR_07740 [Sporothrix brasiliensis 5110]KIH88425.1 hypothetical protein SPBR_07740 [Sporothrix brasiliensis 5110]